MKYHLTHEEIAKVVKVISDQAQVEPGSVTPDKFLIEHLGMDSLDTVELVMGIEDEFDIEIPDEEAEKLRTVGHIFSYLEKALPFHPEVVIDAYSFETNSEIEPPAIQDKAPALKPVGERMLTMEQVFDAIRKERANQDAKWGKNKPQSLAGFMLVARKELEEAEDGWLKDLPGKSAPLNELVQVAAVVVAALERYGVTGNVICTNDIPVPQVDSHN